jgi:hypothetical protein
MQDIEQRIAHIGQGLQAMKNSWPFLLGEINARIEALTISLINNNDEQTRGKIKALIAITELPQTLATERESMSTALSEMDAAD